MKTCMASCGMEIREEDGFVCPYFSRPEEWRARKGGQSACFVNLQYQTNVCLEAPDEFFGLGEMVEDNA